MKKISIFIITILIVLSLVIFSKENTNYAQQTSQTSDIQLLARAINGEARGRKL